MDSSDQVVDLDHLNSNLKNNSFVSPGKAQHALLASVGKFEIGSDDDEGVVIKRTTRKGHGNAQIRAYDGT